MPGRAKKVERTCIATRETGPADAMLRFVWGPDQTLVFDLKQTLPGRGAWIRIGRDYLEYAVKRKLFARSFKQPVTVPSDLVGNVERQLHASALGTLGLARKAGLVATGFTGVEMAVRKGNVVALIHACDGAEDGKRKLEALLRSSQRDRIAGTNPVQVVTMFDARELGLALGRSNVIHAAARIGHASDLFVQKAQLLAYFRGDEARPPPDPATEMAVDQAVRGPGTASPSGP